MDGIGFSEALQGVQLAVFVLALVPLWLLGRYVPGRRLSCYLGIAWILAASCEFWVLGARSYIPTGGELEYSLPLHQFMAEWRPSGRFSHDFAGGNDIASVAVLTGQFFSFERFLVGSLPLGTAVLIHKLMTFGLAYWGMYLLARRGHGASRSLAIGLGTLFTLSHPYIAHTTWAHGIGYALLPMAAYLCAHRLGRRFYWTGIVSLAAIHAVSCSPTHSGVAFFPGLVFLCILAGWPVLLRALPAIAILFIAVLVNFGEAFYAMASLAPFSFRGSAVVTAARYSAWPDPAKFLGSDFLEITVLATGLSLIGLCCRFRHAASTLLVLVMAIGAGATFLNVPWDRIGLAPLRGFSFHNIDFGFSAVALAAIAALMRIIGDRGRATLVLVCLVGAGALGKFAYYKAANTANWLSQGGLSIVTDGNAELRNASWQPSEPMRVLTVPYRLHANMAVGNGLASIDGNLNVLMASMAGYWRNAVLKHPLDMSSGFLTIETRAFDPKCCAAYDLTDQVDLDALRLANVGFILSKLPLQGQGIRQVAGPEGETSLPRSGDPLAMRLSRYFQLIFHEEPVRVYRLQDPVPRVFGLTGLVPFGRDQPAATFYGELRRCADRRCGVVRSDDVPPGMTANLQTVKVVKFTLSTDSVQTEVEAPGGGALAVSTPWLPFWVAEADGKPVRTFSVNEIQLGVEVPAGARRVELRYHAPSLLGRLGLL